MEAWKRRWQWRFVEDTPPRRIVRSSLFLLHNFRVLSTLPVNSYDTVKRSRKVTKKNKFKPSKSSNPIGLKKTYSSGLHMDNPISFDSSFPAANFFYIT
jgi:hypothetical protein